MFAQRRNLPELPVSAWQLIHDHTHMPRDRAILRSVIKGIELDAYDVELRSLYLQLSTPVIDNCRTALTHIPATEVQCHPFAYISKGRNCINLTLRDIPNKGCLRNFTRLCEQLGTLHRGQSIEWMVYFSEDLERQLLVDEGLQIQAEPGFLRQGSTEHYSVSSGNGPVLSSWTSLWNGFAHDSEMVRIGVAGCNRCNVRVSDGFRQSFPHPTKVFMGGVIFGRTNVHTSWYTQLPGMTYDYPCEMRLTYKDDYHIADAWYTSPQFMSCQVLVNLTHDSKVDSLMCLENTI